MRAIRALKIIGYVLAGLILLVLIGYFALHTAPVQKYVLRRAVEALKARGVVLEASDLGYQLADARIALRDVVVRAKDKPSLPPITRAERIEVDLGLLNLLRGTYHVENASIERPQTHVVVTETGETNVPQFQADNTQQQDQEQITFLIEHAQIYGASLTYEDRQRNISAALPDWQVSVNGNPTTLAHDIVFRTNEPGRVSMQGRSLPVESVVLQGVLQQDAADIKTLAIHAAQSEIIASGSVKDFSDPTFDLHADIRAALQRLAEFAAPEQRVAGDLRIRATAEGTIQRLTARAEVNGSDLQVNQFRNLDLSANVTYAIPQNQVSLEWLSLKTPIGLADANGLLSLEEKGASAIHASVRGLQLQPLMRTLEQPLQVASRADMSAAVSFPGMNVQQANGRATIRLTPTREEPAGEVIPAAGVVTAEARGEHVRVNLDQVRALGANMQGRVLLTRLNAIEGAVQVGVQDVQQVLDALRRVQRQREPLLPVPVHGPANVVAELGGTVKAPRVAASAAAPQTRVGQVSGVALQANALYSPDSITVERLRVDLPGQHIEARGKVGLRGTAPALELTAHVDRLSIQSVLAMTGVADAPAQGSISADARVSGTTKLPIADLQFRAVDLFAYGEPLGQMTGTAQLRNQVLRVQNLRLEKPGENRQRGTLDASGSYNLSTKAFQFEATADDLQFRKMVLPNGMPVRADVNMDARGSGTTKDPTVTASLNISDIHLRDQQLGDVSAQASVQNQVARLKAEVPRFSATASGAVGIAKPYRTQFQAAMNGTNLALLPLGAGKKVEGTLTASVEGSLPLSAWQTGTVQARVQNLQATVNGQTIRTEGPALVNYTDQVLTVSNLTLLATGSRFSVDGELPFKETRAATGLSVKGTFDLAALSAFAPAQQKLKANGILALNARIGGSLQRMRPEGTLRLDNGSVGTVAVVPPATNIDLDAELRGSQFEVRNFSAQWASGVVQAKGLLPLALLPANLPIAKSPAATQSANFALSVRGLQLNTIEAVPDRVNGVVSLHASVQAPRLTAEAIKGELVFDELNLELGGIPLNQVAPSTFVVEDGVARVERFELRGPTTLLQLAGTAGLTGDRALNLRFDGNTDAALLGSFVEGVNVEGKTEIRVAARGTLSDPDTDGFVTVTNGQLGMEQPPVSMSDLNLRLDFEGSRVTIANLASNVNGGTLTGIGGISYSKGQLRDSNIHFNARGLFFNYPEGLRTLSDATVALQSREDLLVIGGQVNILEGGYNERLSIEGELLRYLRSGGQTMEFTPERNPILDRVHYHVGVKTLSPLLVDNNLAEAALAVDARFVGTYYRPSITGRVEIEEGGELRLQGRTYNIDRGVVTFLSEARIEPSLDILARTEAADYDITLRISGRISDVETEFTSDPPLPENDILAVLVTGRTLENARGSELAIAQEQALALLAGGFTGALESVTGLSTVRIERDDEEIAAESNPLGRLTVGQDLTRKLSLLFSIDLTDSGDQIWIADYDLTRRFSTQAVKQADNSYRFEFRHLLRFGGVEEKALSRPEPKPVGQVSVQNGNVFSVEKLKDAFDVEPGDDYDFFDVRDGVERVEKLLAKQNRLESRVRADRDTSGAEVDLTLRVQPGPQVEFAWEGWRASGDMIKDVRRIWSTGVFDAQRIAESKQAIRNRMVKQGYLQVAIETEVNQTEDLKRVTFRINPGIRYRNVQMSFPGATAFSHDLLVDLIDGQDLKEELHTEPDQVGAFIERYYREYGYLDAEVGRRQYEFNPQASSAKLIMPVQEGPLYRVGEIRFNGNEAIDDGRLLAEMALFSGSRYEPELRVRSFTRVQDLYWDQGYANVNLDIQLQKRQSEALVDITFNIKENQQRILKEVRVQGTDVTKDSLVLSQFRVKPGEVLTNEKLADARSDLYDTGAYSLVDIDLETLDRSAYPVEARQVPIRATIKVQEIDPYEIRYGAFFDTDRGPGGIADFSARNVLGSARVIGLRTRADGQLQESRLYFTQPQLTRFPLQTSAAAFYQRGEVGDEPGATFRTDRFGVSLQQESRWRDYNVLTFGYRIERNRSFGTADPQLRSAQTVAPLSATFTRETRDNFLDSTKGIFTSHALEYGAKPFGSDLHFYRYLGQYFRYRALSKPVETPFSNQRRPKWIFAGAVRLGVAAGIGDQDLPPTERFFAGGGTTVRGFAQDEIGPKTADGVPLGGESVFILNGELRFPIRWLFEGVGFVDMGNVYPTVEDFRPWDLRKSIGAGLRLRTPYVLLRLDYGVKLDRQPGESRGKLFFSIGQAF